MKLLTLSCRAGARARCGLLVSSALLATAPVSATLVFYDDFQDETLGSNPAIDRSSVAAGDLADVGISWADEENAVDVSANPDTATGNSSTGVYQGHFSGIAANGIMFGHLDTSIFIDGATISFDFYLPGTGNAGNDINLRLMAINQNGTLSGLGGLDLELDGDVGGSSGIFNDGITAGTVDVNHYGSGVWQHAVWTYSNYDSAASTLDVDLAITNLGTGASVSGSAVLPIGATSWDGTEAFTLVSPRMRGNADFEGFIDHLMVEGTEWVIPEPSTLALLGLGIVGLLFRRHPRG